jgi:hypothetical protein
MRFPYRAVGLIAAAVALTALSACSRTQADWRVAQKADTARAYQAFVERHPDSELAAVARQRIAQLTEAAAWQRATRANTAGAYQEYLTAYPNGSWSQDARIRMQSRSLALNRTNSPGVPAGAAHRARSQQCPLRHPAPAPRASEPRSPFNSALTAAALTRTRPGPNSA